MLTIAFALAASISLNQGQPVVDSICGNPATPFRLHSDEGDTKTRWEVAADGSVKVTHRADPIIAFDPQGAEHLIAVVEVASGAKKPQVLACGPVEKNRKYDLKLDGVPENAVLTIRLFVGTIPSQFVSAWKKRYADDWAISQDRLTQNEVPAMEDWAQLPEVFASLVAYKRVASSKHSTELEEALNRSLRKILGSGLFIAGCPADRADPPPRCAAFKRATEVREDLEGLLALVSPPPPPPPRADKKPARKESPIERALRESARERALDRYEFRLKHTAKPKADEQEAYCTHIVSRLEWLSRLDSALLNVMQVPSAPGNSVAELRWATGTTEIKDVGVGERVTLLVKDVPHSAPVAFAAKERAGDKKVELSDALLRILTVVMKAAAGGAGAGNLPKSFACPRQESVMPADAQPLYKSSTHAYVLDKMPDTTVDLLVCDGKACPTAVDDAAVVSRAVVKPRFQTSVTLMARVAADFPIGGTLMEPEYQSIGGTAGPETIYELRYPFDVRRHVSASLLIGARYCERFFSGFGPTLLIGSGGGALTQWDIVPVAYTPTWARGLYVTPSVGLRVVKYATDVNSGSRVPAAGTADVAKPPALGRTDSRPVVVLSLGIGFDLSVVGAAADSLLTSMGAK